jgi:hypothetical protein
MALPNSTSAQVIRSSRNKKRNATTTSRDQPGDIELEDGTRLGNQMYAAIPTHGLTLDGTATLRQVDPKDYLGYFSTRYVVMKGNDSGVVG